MRSNPGPPSHQTVLRWGHWLAQESSIYASDALRFQSFSYASSDRPSAQDGVDSINGLRSIEMLVATPTQQLISSGNGQTFSLTVTKAFVSPL